MRLCKSFRADVERLQQNIAAVTMRHDVNPPPVPDQRVHQPRQVSGCSRSCRPVIPAAPEEAGRIVGQMRPAAGRAAEFFQTRVKVAAEFGARLIPLAWAADSRRGERPMHQDDRFFCGFTGIRPGHGLSFRTGKIDHNEHWTILRPERL